MQRNIKICGTFESAPTIFSNNMKSKIEPDKSNNEKYEKILQLFKELTDIQSDIGDIIEKTDW